MRKIDFKLIHLENNQGHGKARQAAILNTSHELVAIMDADDISLPYRFEKELEIHSKKKVSVVGGQITEFIQNPKNITGIRTVFKTNQEIYKDLKKRCPINQVTAMFRKSDVLAVGGYQDWYCNEDYFLWIRMAERKMVFENLSDVLVNVRIGEEMYGRRGGWRYFQSERRLQKYMLTHKQIGFFRYICNVVIRFGGEVIATNSLRNKLFKLTRKPYDTKIVRQKENESQEKIIISKTASELQKYPPFSVAISVYEKDNPEWFDIALKSIIVQSVKPDEIVLVVDGPIPDATRNVITKYITICHNGDNV